MGKFKKKTSKSATARRQRKADERTAAEASAADADGHADSNAGDADDAGARSSSSGGGGSSTGGGGGGELKVNLWGLISSTESNHIFDSSSHFSKRSRSSRPVVAPGRRARSSRPVVAPARRARSSRREQKECEAFEPGRPHGDVCVRQRSPVRRVDDDERRVDHERR